MENWTVKFLVDCDNKDSRGVYKAGSTETIREDSARFWIDRRMAVKVESAPTKKASTKAAAPDLPTATAEVSKAAADLQAAEAAASATTTSK